MNSIKHKRRGPSCARCRYLVGNDTGYSNYTVTETSYFCLYDMHPQLPAEESHMPWDIEPLREYSCPMYYRCDDRIHVDVEESAIPYGTPDSYFTTYAKYYTNDVWLRMLAEEITAKEKLLGIKFFDSVAVGHYSKNHIKRRMPISLSLPDDVEPVKSPD